jgi:hypothetical protein
MPTAEAMAGPVLLDNRRAHAAYVQLEQPITSQPADALRPVRADVNVICSRASEVVNEHETLAWGYLGDGIHAYSAQGCIVTD